MKEATREIKKVLSIDIGATSGRVMEVSLNSSKLTYNEIRRFKNKVIEKDGNIYWDINYLINEIFLSLDLADKKISSVAISTWGCDICLIDKEGNLIDNPRCYRDEKNVLVQKEFSQKYFSYEEVYRITGIQNLPFNTIYQLLYLKDYQPNIYQKIDKVLMIPDYIAYVLTNVMKIEETNASTTALYSLKEHSFSDFILNKLKIKKDIFPSIIFPGMSYGLIKPELNKRFQFANLEVIACATHDTGSAVRGTLVNNYTAYLISGTWSLMGSLIDRPIMDDQAYRANYTNEIGYNSQIRFLKNIMGMWILEEYRRELENSHIDNSFETILTEFNSPYRELTLIDPDDEIFLPVGKMSNRINDYARRTHQPIPTCRKEYIQTIYYSLAYKYRYVFEKLRDITKQAYHRLNIVGGGTKNNLLSQLVADILQVEVISGPVEATVIGNAMVQYLHYKIIDEKDIQTIIQNDDNIKIFMPNDKLKSYYDNEYHRFKKIMEEKNE